jgi:hypothetical protein
MRTVFISSVQRGFADAREAAAKAIQSLRMHPVMAETAGGKLGKPAASAARRSAWE